MMSENTKATSAAGEPATKPVRRRATRAAAPAKEAPASGTAAPSAPTEAAPAAEKKTTTRRRATRTTSTKAVDAVTAAEVAEPPSTEEPAPAPRTRATRTRKKAADAEAPVADPGAAQTDAPAEAVEEPAPKAKKTTRTRSTSATKTASTTTKAAAAKTTRTRKKVADAQASVEQPADEPAPAAEPVEAAPVEEPAATPVRRRATRKAAQPATDASAPQEPAAPAVAEAPVVAEAAEEDAAPAPRKRSRRATRPAAAAEPPAPEPAEEPALADEAADDQEAEDETNVEAPASLDVPAEPAGRTSTEESEQAPRAGSGRLATTALLFQAPEPAPRRRRRAQVPSGSPEEISAQVAEEEAAQAAEVETPSEEQSGAGKRSRGRRGGRKRSSGGEGGSSTEDAESATTGVPAEEPVVDEAAEAPAQAEDQDVAGDEDGGPDRDGEPGDGSPRRRRRRGGRGRRSRSGSDEQGDGDREGEDEGDGAPAEDTGSADDSIENGDDADSGSSRRRRRRRRSRSGEGGESSRSGSGSGRSDEVTALRGSTRLEAKRQRRREGRDAGRRRQIITESEFLARRESVERSMVVRERDGRTQIAVLEDGVLVEHYVSRQSQTSMVGNVYLGRVQNVLPSMEAAFIDVGRGRNAVLYAGEVNWDAAGLDGQPRRIEQALKSGDPVLVQVTKDPIGHKGARLTSQITLAGRYLVYVPGGGMTGISRKLPENERTRLKKILREVVPSSAGVIVRTAAEGASEDELRADIARLQSQWEAIEKKSKSASAPTLLQGEPDLAIRVVRDIFNDDFASLVVQGDEAWSTVSGYIGELAPDLAQKMSRHTGTTDVFAEHRIDEQLAKGMDRKVWLPSGGSLVIDRTEAMTVVDVNTGKFTGAGGTLEETVTRNNLEAAEEIVRQLRLRDIGGIIVIDFIDMVLESNRDLVLRRLVECLGRDRTKHQVAEVTSLGLVQMTRKRVGQGLVEAFSETCEHCHGRGFIVHTEPVEKNGRADAGAPQQATEGESKKSRRKRGGKDKEPVPAPAAEGAAAAVPVLPEAREAVKATLATIAAAAAHAHGSEEPAAAEEPAPARETAPVAEPAPAPAPGETVAEPAAAQEPVPAPRTRSGRPRRATRSAGRPQGEPTPVTDGGPEQRAGAPVLDVLAALGDLAPRGSAVQHGAASSSGAEPDLELTPVDPSVFDEPADGGSPDPTD